MEKTLREVSAALGPVIGAITLALASRRGVTRARLRVWAAELRQVATALEEASR